MADLGLPEKNWIETQILENPDILRKTLNDNPALLNYIFSDAEIQRKYVKINPKADEGLKQLSNDTGLAEGLLLGLGIALLLAILFRNK